MSRQPHRRLSVFKWITCTIEPHQRPKNKSHHTCKHGLCLESSCCNCRQLELLEQYWKGCHGCRLTVTVRRIIWKNWSHTAASCFNTHSTDRWEAGNWTTVSLLYLHELLIQKCKFRHRVVASTFCLEEHSRRVHATLTNPAWITHLLRTVIANFDVECNRRAKKTTVNWHEEWKTIRIYIYVYIDV